MSQTQCSPAAKTNKPISKGNQVWKRVNKVAHRLMSKGVPVSIVAQLQHVPTLTPQVIGAFRFDRGATLREMSALAKLQSIQVLELSIKREESIIDLKRKQTEMTDAGYYKRPNLEIKQNWGEVETNNSARPQEAEAVFT